MSTLLIDGYNLLLRSPEYALLAEEDLDAARAALVSDVSAYAHGTHDVTIVFDGGGNPGSDGQPHIVCGVTVVFSAFGREADTVVESLARAARERGDEVVVVTSDQQMRWAVSGGAVSHMSADAFARDLSEGAAEWREHAPAGSTSGRLEDRIDPQTRDTLARWARGGL
jgi:predicted RNA-binding protein with PIN domain